MATNDFEIKVFDQEWIELHTNTDNYRDSEHYGAHINSQILKWMSEDEGLLTGSNYMECIQKERNYFMNYDYDSIFGGQ